MDEFYVYLSRAEAMTEGELRDFYFMLKGRYVMRMKEVTTTVSTWL